MRRGIYYMCCLLLLLSTVESETKVVYPLDPVCHMPLGLENNDIKDNKITTPAGTIADGKEGYHARLNNNAAWCIKHVLNSTGDIFKENVYVEITLLAEAQITAIALQGNGQYSYGNVIRLQYDSYGGFMNYQNNSKDKNLRVKNLNGDQYEYLVLNPSITAKKLRIRLLSGSNIKCLRAELYGCMDKQRLLEYKECKKREILKSENIENITQSDFTKFTREYDGNKVLFSEPDAWCVKKDTAPTDLYRDWVQVNMKGDYLLYGIKVDGYKGSDNDNLAVEIKLNYSLDAKDRWASYKGGMSIPTAKYRSNYLKFEPPLVAKLIRVSIRNNGTDNVCLKMQFSGCSGVLYDEKLIPTKLTNNTNSTTDVVSARITQYKIFQGIEYFDSTYGSLKWHDTKYDGKLNAKDELTGGKGCLIDGSYSSTSTPFEDSTCWIGWKKSNISSPFIFLETSRADAVTGIVIRTYVDENIGASAIKRFKVDYSPFITLPKTLGYTCAPTNVYHISPRIVDFHLDLNGITAQYINLKFEYSGEWILIRQVTLRQDSIAGERYLKMSVTTPTCLVPEKEKLSTEESSDSGNIVLIVCVVLAMCFLLVLAFLMYHYRTRLHKIFKVRTAPPIIVKSSYDKDKSAYNNTSAYFYNNVRDDDVYAAPESVVSFESEQSLLVTDGPKYAQYNIIADPPTAQSTPYAMPNAQPPNQDTSSNAIYQGSVIYAQSYKSPYQAVLGSTMYADPEKVYGTSTLRQFPRDQLTFKEKIGVGQFGEVHIAVATGLDEIYGNMGHYNSWGLPDTAHVALKVLKCDDDMIEKEFMKEVDVMAQLKHENVVRLLGVCRDKPMVMVCEYMENGDLNQFLRSRKPCDENNIRASMIPADALLSDSLLHMAQQIAAGMKYLHSEGFIHRDLATRNCLVGPAYQVKIADFGMSRSLYSKQYYRVEGKAILPIRWMAPECMFYGKFTNSTDAWSFGVTLWEIFSFARNTPYEELNDPQVIELCCEAVQQPERGFPYLEQPIYCPPEVYQIIQKCWQLEPEHRPSFAYFNRAFNELCSSAEGEI